MVKGMRSFWRSSLCILDKKKIEKSKKNVSEL